MKTDELIWKPPLSKRIPLSTNPLLLDNFFMIPIFVQISKTRNPLNFMGGESYVVSWCLSMTGNSTEFRRWIVQHQSLQNMWVETFPSSVCSTCWMCIVPGNALMSCHKICIPRSQSVDSMCSWVNLAFSLKGATWFSRWLHWTLKLHLWWSLFWLLLVTCVATSLVVPPTLSTAPLPWFVAE